MRPTWLLPPTRRLPPCARHRAPWASDLLTLNCLSCLCLFSFESQYFEDSLPSVSVCTTGGWGGAWNQKASFTLVTLTF